MDGFISPEDSFKVEDAIQFLVTRYTESGQNPKPVILHSLRVGIHLLELGYGTDIIITGILHDLIEDTDITSDDIKNEFGSDIATWVEAVSFKSEIGDPTQRYKEMFERTISAGKTTVVVKAVDMCVNSLYINLVPDVQKQRLLVEKIRYFLDATKTFSTEPAIKQLEDRYEKEDARLANIDSKK